MFTGLVEDRRPVVCRRPRGDGGLDLEVDLGALAEGVRIGDSIALSGACLTVAKLAGTVATFELSPETLARTAFGSAATGALVNVERALELGARLGGHLVQGHVDGLARVGRIVKNGEWVELEVHLDAALGRYCVEKGSIALDGVSLTIARLTDGPTVGTAITIALVPLTLEKTTLGDRRPGDALHVEVDCVAKYVDRLARPYARP